MIFTDASLPGMHFKILTCPSDPTARENYVFAKTSYQANWYALSDGRGGLFAWFPPVQRFTDLANGTSNVVLFAEGYSRCAGVNRPALNTPWYHTFGITQDRLPSDDPFYLPNDYTMFQTRPNLTECDKWRTQTPHQTMNVCLADGSARYVASSISPQTWKQVLKPRGDSPPDGDW